MGESQGDSKGRARSIGIKLRFLKAIQDWLEGEYFNPMINWALTAIAKNTLRERFLKKKAECIGTWSWV